MNQIRSLLKINLLEIGILLFIFSFFFGAFLISLCTIILTAIGLYYIFLNRKQFNFSNYPKLFILLNILPVLISVLDLLSNGFIAESQIKIWKDYYVFIFFPLFIFMNQNQLKPRIVFFSWFFVVIALANLTYILVVALFQGFILNDFQINYWNFGYRILAKPSGVHPIYLSILYTLAIGILLNQIQSRKNRIIIFGSIAYLLLGIILLASRMSLLVAVIIILIFLFQKNFFSYKKIIIFFLVFSGFFSLVMLNPILEKRYKTTFESKDFFSGSNLRMNVWKSAFEVVEEAPIFGVGYSSAQEELNENYRKNKLIIPFKEKYHAHNLYLQSALYMGFFGLFFWMAFVLISSKTSLQHGVHHLFFVICLMLLLNGMTESLFERIQGRNLFTFFICLYFLALNKNKEKTDIQNNNQV